MNCGASEYLWIKHWRCFNWTDWSVFVRRQNKSYLKYRLSLWIEFHVVHNKVFLSSWPPKLNPAGRAALTAAWRWQCVMFSNHFLPRCLHKYIPICFCFKKIKPQPCRFCLCVCVYVCRYAATVQDGSQYFVLLIITDGVISDMAQTKEAIVNVRPLSFQSIVKTI